MVRIEFDHSNERVTKSRHLEAWSVLVAIEKLIDVFNFRKAVYRRILPRAPWGYTLGGGIIARKTRTTPWGKSEKFFILI